MHITMPHVEVNLGADEFDMIAEACLTHALIEFLLCGSQSLWLVIVERFGATKPRKAGFNGPECRRKRRTGEIEALVGIGMSRIQITELLAHLFEFFRRDIVVLHLNVNSG